MKDLIQLFGAYAKSGIRSYFAYRLDAIMRTIAVFLRESAGVVAIYLALLKFDTINGWNIDELIFLFSLIFITYALFIMFFKSFRDFSIWVKRGEFDRVLLRPRGLLTQLILCGGDWLATFGHGALGISLFLLSAGRVGIRWNLGLILYYLASIIGGVLIQGALFLIFSTVSFYVVESSSLQNLIFWNMRSFAVYAISIYPRIIQTILIYVVPLSFVNYFPAQFFLRKADMADYPTFFLYLSPFVGVVLFGLACLFWKFSLKFYQSTGN